MGSTEDVAQFLQISDRMVAKLIKAGLPRQPVEGKPSRFTYDLREIHKWRLDHATAGKKSADDAPGLERYRQAKATREEFALARDLKTVIPRDHIVAILNAGGEKLRKFGDILQKRFGPDAWDLWEEYLSEANRSIEDALNAEV